MGLVILEDVFILGSDGIGLELDAGRDVDIPGKDVIGLGLEDGEGCKGLEGEDILDDVG